jgi:hypothetical protein
MRNSTSRAHAITAIVFAAGASSACTASEGIFTVGLFGLGVIARMVWGAASSARTETRPRRWNADRDSSWDGQPWSTTESIGSSHHGHHGQDCADGSNSGDSQCGDTSNGGSPDCGDSGGGDSGGGSCDGGGGSDGGSSGGGD